MNALKVVLYWLVSLIIVFFVGYFNSPTKIETKIEYRDREVQVDKVVTEIKYKDGTVKVVTQEKIIEVEKESNTVKETIVKPTRSLMPLFSYGYNHNRIVGILYSQHLILNIDLVVGGMYNLNTDTPFATIGVKYNF